MCPWPEEASLAKPQGLAATVERMVIKQPSVLHHNQKLLLCPPANQKENPSEVKGETCVAQQTVEFPSQFREEERTPTKPWKDPVFHESNSKEEDDPIESGTIIPMMPR